MTAKVLTLKAHRTVTETERFDPKSGVLVERLVTQAEIEKSPAGRITKRKAEAARRGIARAGKEEVRGPFKDFLPVLLEVSAELTRRAHFIPDERIMRAAIAIKLIYVAMRTASDEPDDPSFLPAIVELLSRERAGGGRVTKRGAKAREFRRLLWVQIDLSGRGV